MNNEEGEKKGKLEERNKALINELNETQRGLCWFKVRNLRRLQAQYFTRMAFGELIKEHKVSHCMWLF